MGDINDSDEYWDSFFTNVFQNSSHTHRSRTQDRDDHVSHRHIPPDENYRERSRSPYDRRVGGTSRNSNHSYEHRWQKSTDNYRPTSDNRNSLDVNYPTSTKIRPDLYTGPIHTEETTNAKELEFETYGLNTDFLDYLNIQGPLNSRIYVTNFETKVDELKLREVFHLCGKIVDLYIVGKKQKPRYAVIEFDHPLEAVQAISMLNNQKLYDKELMIRMEKQTDDLKLPAGLSRVGMGLGPDGKPLRNITARLFANHKQHHHETSNFLPKEELDPPPLVAHTSPSFRNASSHNFSAVKRERESPFRNALPINNSTTIRGSPSFRNPSPLNSTTVRVSPPFRKPPPQNDSIRDCSPPEISYASDLSSPTYSTSPAHSSYIPLPTYRRSITPTFSRDSPPRHSQTFDDKWYTDLYDSVLEKPDPNYRIKGKKLLVSKTDVVYKTPEWREVVPRAERRDRFEKCHRTACGKHLDTARTFRRLSTYYYWPSIRDDVEYFRSLCNICSGPKSR